MNPVGLNYDAPLGAKLTAVSYVMILMSAVLITIDSLPNIHEKFGQPILTFELLLSGFFAFEYIMRLRASQNPLRYAFSFWGIIDLIAIIPFTLIFGGSVNSTKALRLLRLARLFKLLKIGNAHSRLFDAFDEVRHEILVFFCLAFGAVFLAAVGIYHFEHSAQPEVFSSIPASMWWAVATLTTVGYGDIYPITIGGKIFTSLILVLGLSLVAIPTGLFSAALLRAKERESQKEE